MDKLLIRKDAFEDIIEKGYGKRDYSKLTKKVITDKNGHRRTVFVKNDVTQTTQKQPKTQELSEEKRAKYEEMLEKVKAGPDENALFVRGEMLNKKDAISYLELKLGRRNGVVAEQKMKMEDEKKNAAMRDSLSRNTAQKMADAEDKAFAESEKDAQKKYGNMSIEELKAEAKKYDGVSKYSPEANEARKVYDVLNQKLAAEKKNSKTKTESKSKKFSYDDAVNAIKEGKTVQWKSRDGSWNDVDPKTSELVMARDIGSELRVKPTQDDMKENYLDAKNEAGKDISEENTINTLSKTIEFTPEETNAIQSAADSIGYKPGKEGALINELSKINKDIYHNLLEKNQKTWDKSGKSPKTFSGFDLIQEKIKSMNIKANPVSNKFANMSGKDIVSNHISDLPMGRSVNTKSDLLNNIKSELNYLDYLKQNGSAAFNENKYNLLTAAKNNIDEVSKELKLEDK